MILERHVLRSAGAMVRAHSPPRNGGRDLGLEFAAMNAIQVVDIAHAIQLALAPVFLFSGIGVLLGVLTNRLARIVDRARKVEDNIRQAAATDLDAAREQLEVASRRARFINISITLSTIAALLIALVVALIFASTFVPMNLAAYIAVLFVLAMLALTGCLIVFLREIFLAVSSARRAMR
jgi:hypothetical protein